MNKDNNKRGILGTISDGLSYTSKILSQGLIPSITEGAEKIMRVVDHRIVMAERRIMRKMYSFLLIGFGGVFLILSLFSFLKEFLEWSSSAAYLSIGSVILVIGIILKIGEYERRRNGY